jgi:hypothetical protein
MHNAPSLYKKYHEMGLESPVPRIVRLYSSNFYYKVDPAWNEVEYLDQDRNKPPEIPDW